MEKAIGNSREIQVGKKSNSVWRRVLRYKYFYLMLLPGVIYFVVFSYLPMVGITLAFQDYKIGKGFFDSPWVGLKWFEKFLQTPNFMDALKNTLIINFYSIVAVFPAPIILAILLNEVRAQRFKKTVQTLTYLPHFLTWAMVGSFLFIILNPGSGIVNQVMIRLGFNSFSFLTENSAIRPIMIFSWIWKEIGWGSIIYLATISNVPLEQYESAKLEGANKWQQMTRITLPSMAFIISFQFVFKISDLFGNSFDMSKALLNASTYKNGLGIAMYIYDYALLKGQFSYGAAIGLAQSLMAFLLLIAANKLTKKMGQDGVF